MGQQISIALHNHSRWSYDGSWSLKGLARFFGTLGYDAVMMTEHDTGFDPDAFAAYRAECAAASTVRCRIIPGIEYSSPDNRIHILTWGLESFLAEHPESPWRGPMLLVLGETLVAQGDYAGGVRYLQQVTGPRWARAAAFIEAAEESRQPAAFTDAALH